MNTADPTLIFLFLVSILYLPVAGVILVRRDLRERAVGWLVLYVLGSSLWVLGQAFSRLGWFSLDGDALMHAPLYGALLLSLLFLFLNRTFLRLEGPGWGWWVLGVAGIVVGIVANENLLSLPEVLWAGDGWQFQRQDLNLGVLILGWAILMGGATLLTIRAYRQAYQPLHRNRIIYWPLALGPTAVGFLLLFLGYPEFGSFFHSLGVLGAAYVVLTFRLPDVRWMARRLTSYLIVSALTILIYTAGFLLVQYAFQSVPAYSSLLAGMTMALVLVVFLQPLLGRLQRIADHLVSGIGYDPSHTLREYSMSISNILDLERLATVVTDLINEAIGVQRGMLFVVHYGEPIEAGEPGHFRLQGVAGAGEEAPTGMLSAKGQLANHLLRDRRTLTQYDIDLLPRFRDLPLAEREWLVGLDMDVYVPIHTKGEWIGLLALGPKVSGDRYFDDDLTLLSTLADQTAVALENARLFNDLERLNRELTIANYKLSRLDQAKTNFIDIASHELRTPLTQVSGYNEVMSEMIEEGSLTPDNWMPMMQDIKQAVGRLKEVVDVMIDVSQLDAEALDLSTISTSLGSIVQNAVASWSKALRERQLTLTIEGLEDVPDIVADGERLKQVFSQLIQNAIKNTPDGGQIQITSHLLGAEDPLQDQAIEITVSDTGIGIPTSDLEFIFEKFYRVGDVMAHSTGETKFKGAGPGLGLTIARGIVEAHGGRIWAESPGYDEVNCPGSTFHVVLPVQLQRP